MAKITLDQLSKSYGSTEVLHHINGDIDDGSLVVSLGLRAVANQLFYG